MPDPISQTGPAPSGGSPGQGTDGGSQGAGPPDPRLGLPAAGMGRVPVGVSPAATGGVAAPTAPPVTDAMGERRAVGPVIPAGGGATPPIGAPGQPGSGGYAPQIPVEPPPPGAPPPLPGGRMPVGPARRPVGPVLPNPIRVAPAPKPATPVVTGRRPLSTGTAMPVPGPVSTAFDPKKLRGGGPPGSPSRQGY